MKLVLDPADPSPKFRQLMRQIQRQIVAGTLMPNLRHMALAEAPHAVNKPVRTFMDSLNLLN